jgi:hypothetical protein
MHWNDLGALLDTPTARVLDRASISPQYCLCETSFASPNHLRCLYRGFHLHIGRDIRTMRSLLPFHLDSSVCKPASFSANHNAHIICFCHEYISAPNIEWLSLEQRKRNDQKTDRPISRRFSRAIFEHDWEWQKHPDEHHGCKFGCVLR